MKEFLMNVWTEYPIPKSVSVWGGIPEDDNEFDLNMLIKACLKELQSDIYVSETMVARSNINAMPEGTISIVSAQLQIPIQGNVYVKKTYMRGTNQLYLRYFPAVVNYRRKVRIEDIDDLEGDMLIYFKSYVLWKMSAKELVVITSVKLDADNGEVNTEDLVKFRDACKEKYEDLKPEILIYTNSN